MRFVLDRSGGPEGGWPEQDLGAVGAVGAPGAVGLSFDPESVVDLGVVPLAQQREVGQVGPAAVEPFQDMVGVGLAPIGRTSFTAA
jgi:hypothetical protein